MTFCDPLAYCRLMESSPAIYGGVTVAGRSKLQALKQEEYGIYKRDQRRKRHWQELFNDVEKCPPGLDPILSIIRENEPVFNLISDFVGEDEDSGRRIDTQFFNNVTFDRAQSLIQIMIQCTDQETVHNAFRGLLLRF